MEKENSGEGECNSLSENFTKSLKRQENILTLPLWYKVDFFSELCVRHRHLEEKC